MAHSRWIPDYVLLHGDGFPGHLLYSRKKTTAHGTTSINSCIDVTLSCPERPLLPTLLFVRCSRASEPARVVCAAEDLILLRILVGPPPRDWSVDNYDYFVYRGPGTDSENKPSLKRLERPHPSFHDEDVGLLRRGDDLYTIAALIQASKFGVYDLHRFDSGTGKWSQVKVTLVEPQAPFPCYIPLGHERLRYHLTSTVITIGGEGGTMGWVDLWYGILLCDVLRDQPTLRGVPMPLPMEMLGHGIDFGCPKPLRGITFIDKKPGSEPYLRLVHLEAKADPIPRLSDEEPWKPNWEMHDWAITTWSNHKMSTSYDDWHMDCKAKASETSICEKLMKKMLDAGLLSPGAGEAQPERAFQNLLVSCPAPGINDDVVYLQARVRYSDPKAFVLALDTKNNALLGEVEFATERKRGAGILYFPSSINRYINPKDRILPIPKGDEDGLEESSQHEGTENLEIVPIGVKFPSHWLV